MKAALDSAFAPTLAQAQQAKAGGVATWGGYLPGPGIYHAWAPQDFDTVRAAGLGAVGFCSGWSSAASIKALAQSYGVLPCLDVEGGGLRPDGPWVQPWLDASGAGLYGQESPAGSVHARRTAAFHIGSWYPGYDPAADWPPGHPLPSTPCGWQWQGSHVEYGVSVDSSWYDDNLVALLGGQLTQDEIDAVLRNALGWAVPGRPPTNNDIVTWRNVYLNGTATNPEWKGNLSLVCQAIQQNPDSVAAQQKLAALLQTPAGIPPGTKFTATVD